MLERLWGRRGKHKGLSFEEFKTKDFDFAVIFNFVFNFALDARGKHKFKTNKQITGSNYETESEVHDKESHSNKNE